LEKKINRQPHGFVRGGGQNALHVELLLDAQLDLILNCMAMKSLFILFDLVRGRD
jgi:hypothetical protein